MDNHKQRMRNQSSLRLSTPIYRNAINATQKTESSTTISLKNQKDHKHTINKPQLSLQLSNLYTQLKVINKFRIGYKEKRTPNQINQNLLKG